MRILLAIILIHVLLYGHAQYGILDPSFGLRGIASGGFNGFDNYAYVVAVQPDGKILMAGNIDYDANSTYTREWSITRYNSDGTIDLGFGINGSDTTDFPQAWNSCSSLNIMPNGKILLGGFADGNVALVRYMPDGSADPTFGANGIATFNVSTGGYAVSVKIASDGSIIVGCPAFSGVGSGNSYTFLRADSIGQIDPTFGNNGVTYIGDGQNNWYCNGIVLLCDGSILATGAQGTPFTFTTMHITSDGFLDRNFGNNGLAKTSFSGTLESDGNAIAVKHDGRILVAGTLVGRNSFNYALAQYTSDGQPDHTFGNNGVAIGNLSTTTEVQAMILQADEKILVSNSGLARLNTDGSPDLSFGNGGQAYLMAGSATGIAIEPDGRILQAGYTSFPFKTLLARCTSGVGAWSADSCPPPARWMVPTGFTPNGDSLNNTYYIIADGPLKSFSLHITNRWGETIFSSSDISDHWDGTYHGKPQPEGMYFCSVCAEDYDGRHSCQSKIITLLR